MELINNYSQENPSVRNGATFRNIIEDDDYSLEDSSNLFIEYKSPSYQGIDIFYPTEINNLETASISKPSFSSNTYYGHKPFIEANTVKVDLNHLKHQCIIPVFSKDNEKTIAHQEFIELVLNAVQRVFPHHTINSPEIRVSHQIKGRTPDAIYKSVKDL